MKIEFLYFKDGCPNYKKAYLNLLEVLKEEEVFAEIELINIKTNDDAKNHKFVGSPSIRINGKDIDEEKAELDKNYDPTLRLCARKCRVYNIDGKIVGVPTKEFIRKAIKSQLNT